MVHPFSPAGRTAALARMAAGESDLLVIGGGITGCGLARAAALAGLRVALVEKVDFGYGTSGRSSKLVHGGLRYLRYGDLKLVRESGHERRVLQRIAPHLVRPLAFVYPVRSRAELAVMSAVFALYDRLSGANAQERHRRLSAPEVRERASGLAEPLLAGIQYGEYLTDDGRLTLENGISAAEHGALVANHAAVTGLLHERERVVGARVRDLLTGDEYPVRARAVVNATGPWAEQTLRLSRATAPGAILPSRGIHVAFPAPRLPVTGAVVLHGRDGRQGFAIRRGDLVYVGTTDEAYHGPLDEPMADRAAVESLLGLVRHSFPALDLQGSEIVSVWAGLRPLIAQPGRAPRDTSRRDRIWVGENGLVTVAGGKLTTYRATAERVLRRVCRSLRGPGRLAAAPRTAGRLTASVPLPGGNLAGRPVAAWQSATAAGLRERGVTEPAATELTWRYGSRVQSLLDLAAGDAAWLQPVAPGAPVLRGEVRLAVLEEMALTLADFLDRRAGLLLLDPDHGAAAVEGVALLMGELLGWSEGEREAQVAAYRTLIDRHGVGALLAGGCSPGTAAGCAPTPEG